MITKFSSPEMNTMLKVYSVATADAAEAIKHGLLQSKLHCTCTCFPVADGGDGTAALLIEKLNGTIIHTEVYDPLKRKINASFGFIDKGTAAVIELADGSGLRLLQPEEYDPLHTSTFGIGEMIKHALDKDAKKIIIGIGGSATVDGGTGILEALGIRFLDSEKNVLQHLPEGLTDLAFIDTVNIDISANRKGYGNYQTWRRCWWCCCRHVSFFKCKTCKWN